MSDNNDDDNDVNDNHDDGEDDDDYAFRLQGVRCLQTLPYAFLRQPEVIHSIGCPSTVVSICCNLETYDLTPELDYTKRPVLVSNNSNL